MLGKEELRDLMITVAKADRKAPVAYTVNNKEYGYEDLNEALRVELKEIAGTYSLYRENKNTLFSLIEQTIDEILPKKVMDKYAMFAEIKTFAQGDKPVFTRKEGAKRAKQFITRVGLAGIYEVFKLDKSSFEVGTSAYGGAAQIGFEEFLDGRVDFSEVTQIIMEGLDEAIYAEIAKSLIAGLAQLPEANKKAHAGFDAAKMDSLIAISRAYGEPTVYCTYEFAATMLPDQAWASNEMKNEVGSNGYLGNYKGARVIVLPQSFEDETNSVKVIDPSYAWVIPTGGNDKPVKVAMEGQTIVDEYVNKDRSRELQVYKKIGVASMMTNNICSYVNTALV